MLARGEVERDPLVRDLPDDVRDEQADGDHDAERRLAAQQQVAAPERAAGEEGRERHDDRVLRLEPDAAPEPEQQPLARLGAHDQARRRDQRERGGRELEERRVEEHRAAEAVGRRDPGGRGQHLQPRACPELARDRADRHRRDGGEQRGEQPQRDQRRADGGVDGARGDGDERREVDVAEREMAAGGEEVELVAIPAVALQQRNEQRELRERQQRAQPAGARRRERHCQAVSRSHLSACSTSFSLTRMPGSSWPMIGRSSGCTTAGSA